jgi:hypothetical protein
MCLEALESSGSGPHAPGLNVGLDSTFWRDIDLAKSARSETSLGGVVVSRQYGRELSDIELWIEWRE